MTRTALRRSQRARAAEAGRSAPHPLDPCARCGDIRGAHFAGKLDVPGPCQYRPMPPELRGRRCRCAGFVERGGAA